MRKKKKKAAGLDFQMTFDHLTSFNPLNKYQVQGKTHRRRLMTTESAENVLLLPSHSGETQFIIQMAWVFMPDVRLDN